MQIFERIAGHFRTFAHQNLTYEAIGVHIKSRIVSARQIEISMQKFPQMRLAIRNWVGYNRSCYMKVVQSSSAHPQAAQRSYVRTMSIQWSSPNW